MPQPSGPVPGSPPPTTTPISSATSELEIEDTRVLMALAGPRNERLKALELAAGVTIGLRGNTLRLGGDPANVELAERFLTQTATLLAQGVDVDTSDVARALATLRAEPGAHLRDMFDAEVHVGAGRRSVGPRGLAQKRYVDAIRSHDLTFGIGPAGTGKTYLAMACAVAALTARKVKRIVLTRPAVEAGEKLGFLPGDLAEKVNPYLRPLYDALDDMMDLDKAQGLIARGHIEVAPLAFMRGRTLNDSFVILDEAQNTTSEQMRMFLTRLGYHSKAVVTGDVTQVDLPDGRTSGLAEARALLEGIEGIAFCQFHVGRRRTPPARAEDHQRVRGARCEARPVTRAEATVSPEAATVDRVLDLLQRDPRLATDAVTRPHELLVVVWRTLVSGSGRARERLCVVFAPAALWDRARELLAPFTDRFAEGHALLVLLGHPDDPSLGDATSRGLASVVDAGASEDELYLAAHRAFELLEAKAAPRRAATGCAATATSSAS